MVLILHCQSWYIDWLRFTCHDRWLHDDEAVLLMDKMAWVKNSAWNLPGTLVKYL